VFALVDPALSPKDVQRVLAEQLPDPDASLAGVTFSALRKSKAIRPGQSFGKGT
jgi:hypothetical protein